MLPESGFYRDESGRIWHCVVTETSVQCNAFDGLWTFARWQWKRATDEEVEAARLALAQKDSQP
jgi:hypothetical protein